jgi:hypothetical protein
MVLELYYKLQSLDFMHVGYKKELLLFMESGTLMLGIVLPKERIVTFIGNFDYKRYQIGIRWTNCTEQDVRNRNGGYLPGHATELHTGASQFPNGTDYYSAPVIWTDWYPALLAVIPRVGLSEELTAQV